MKLSPWHNFKSYICILLMVSLLTPSIVKLSHAINEHEHFECTAMGELHVHEVEMDCDFQKFNLSNYIYPELVESPKAFIVPLPKKCFLQYTFLNKYQKLHFSLRGPPPAILS